MIRDNLDEHLHKLDKGAMLTRTKARAPAQLSEAGEATTSVRKNSRGQVEIVTDLCKGCLLCIEACPPTVLKMSDCLNKMGYHPVAYAGEGCTGCGICFYICPEPGTIRVYKRIKQH